MTIATNSSAASEFIAAGNAPDICALLMEGAKELDIIKGNTTLPIIYLDSQPVLQAINRGWAPYEPLYAALSRAAKLRICTMSELQKQNLINFKFCRTDDNLADCLTKILDAAKTKRIREHLNMD